jgi:hypothetical protein
MIMLNERVVMKVILHEEVVMVILHEEMVMVILHEGVVTLMVILRGVVALAVILSKEMVIPIRKAMLHKEIDAPILSKEMVMVLIMVLTVVPLLHRVAPSVWAELDLNSCKIMRRVITPNIPRIAEVIGRTAEIISMIRDEGMRISRRIGDKERWFTVDR